MSSVESAKLSVLVDNEAHSPFRPEWGLSIKVTTPKWTLLWDAGASGGTLKFNASLMEESLRVDYLAFSHRHWDHVGGRREVEAQAVFGPNDPAFPFRAKPVSKTVEVDDGLYLLKTLEGDGVREIAAVINVEDFGGIMLVGCSHPGVTSFYEVAMKDLNIKPKVVIGGFHLFGKPKRMVEGVIAELKRLGAEELHPIHCSGEYAKTLARSSVAAGSVLVYGE